MKSAPKLNLEKSMALYEEAKRLSPGGLLGIRRPYNFVPDEYPIFIDHGYGGHIVDVDGNDYIDMLCAYGPIILGYNEPEINDAVKAQMDKGFCFSMVQEVQNRLEQKLIDLIPCAEMVVLAKTGSDVTSIATRIARGYTGKDKILRCGYHGWHDWCVESGGGVPDAIKELTIEFEYGSLESLEEALKAHHENAACIIVTPVGHPLALPVMAPPEGYLQGVRALADKYNVVLIFDEIRTGFRVAMGGAGERYGVTPDLSVFGKAMANGYPISACVGKAEIMKVLEEKVFVSSTFFPNSLEMVAALKCIEILERDNIIETVWEKGQYFLDGIEKLIAKHNAPVTLSGIPPMPFITFDKVDADYKKRRTQFYTETIRRGLFIQPYHHGYIAARHTTEDLDAALLAIDEALAVIGEMFPTK
ncbi:MULTISPECIES: aspartate aminotransferase family protein [unclassified Fusibacter]|uniref:aspartate aminotransferase family protein n=1 Tax=unclassified Fusibacter TaxID=2624464 RepID=UPI001012D33E|nr:MULTISPECIES: aminotransferase class III-fold pyridoxal phosphate-dependent enzyme [unclassified Fusibacter]MCK8059423.1 aminotransferase class III-fold pyridoxal phosphate-dependent enzyme [Fusibacter sp. A2]NPE21113.1 aminotransferase class III-fold pyridoxal phosphate-dependent enzyme [Fusibacter sp. A1]RXV62383.1 aminotransferase class III-fold pyridoxal phosphate-dependent enzyme [Fusibacter sp. A1]